MNLLSHSHRHWLQRIKLPEYYVPPSLAIRCKALQAVAEERDQEIRHITILRNQGLWTCVREEKEYHKVPLSSDQSSTEVFQVTWHSAISTRDSVHIPTGRKISKSRLISMKLKASLPCSVLSCKNFVVSTVVSELRNSRIISDWTTISEGSSSCGLERHRLNISNWSRLADGVRK